MLVGDVSLEDDLVQQLVACGRQGHEVARAHSNDPGSNGFTWGTDRYQRSTQLAMDRVLTRFGFGVGRRGAGLVARRGDVELQFAVAKGVDLTNPESFDAGSSLARRKAGRHNADQSILTGLEVPDVVAEPVLHVVWSGDADRGLTAVHIGRLVLSAEDVLDWAVLERVSYPATTSAADLARVVDTDLGTPAPTYVDQPEPEVPVERRRPQPGRKSDDEG